MMQGQRTRQTRSAADARAVSQTGEMRSLILTIILLCCAASSFGKPLIFVSFSPPPFVDQYKDCPGPMLEELYIVVVGLDMYFAGVELAISYPPEILFLADIDTPPVTIGSSLTGISMAWPLPRNGFETALLFKVAILWSCSDCSVTNSVVKPVRHPIFHAISATRWPGLELVELFNRRSYVCPAGVPIERSTWGRIKSIYGE